MSIRLSVADISSYLDVTGWERSPERWRGAVVWGFRDDFQVLVPDGDGYADADRRVRETLRLLADVEGRPLEEVAADIAAPMADVQWYRAPAVTGDGLLALTSALTGVREVIAAGARAAAEGPRAQFHGAAPKPVRDLQANVRTGPVTDQVLTVRLPVGAPESLARQMLLLLHRAMPAMVDVIEAAQRSGALEGFDGLVPLGVSADLCAALARFAGTDPGAGFEIGFRWARGLPAEVPGRAVEFGAGSGRLLRTAANRLRRRAVDDVSVMGTIGTLFDNGAGDRFRVLVHGLVTAEAGRSRSGLWVRLPDEAAYHRAYETHRARRPVRATGTLRTVDGRQELTAVSFEELIDDLPEES